ncbi:MAG TPA: hypothetical protein VEJ87_00435 [Acidimicrobiales bacterium]|nr:hypothetical protein [Acidimicrobiales bacterium]
MTVQTDSAAVKIARSHIDAWAKKDWATARIALASDVHVVVSSTNPELPVTDTVGPDDYMVGLEMWAGNIAPGSVKEISAVGDEKNALITLTVEADFGFGRVVSPGARLYLLDDDNKIAIERVIFFLAP